MHISHTSLRPSRLRGLTATTTGVPRVLLAAGALVAGTFVSLASASPVAAAPIPGGDITLVCTGTTSPDGTTFTLTADCGEVTTPLTVPPGITTIDGADFTISATDLAVPGGPAIPQFNGGIVTNAVPGQTMNIQNVTITGPATGFQLCTISTNVLYGIFFNDAGGSVSNVTVDHIFQFQNGAFGSCQTGRAIRADGLTDDHTVTITDTVVMDYQKSGFEARGTMTMNLSGSTAGPPHPLEGLISQNGVSLVGTTTGIVEFNTIHGSSDQAPGPGGLGAGTAMLLSNADNATVTENLFIGSGTDIGISVSAGSTGNTISFNDVTRTPSENPANVDALVSGSPWIRTPAQR